MTQPITRPAELDDLDRYEGQVVPQDAYERMVHRFDALVYQRVLAERDAVLAVARAQQLKRVRRHLWRLAWGWLAVSVAAAVLAFQLQRAGQ